MKPFRLVSLSIILILNILLSYTTAFADTKTDKTTSWPKAPSLISKASIVMDANTGVILYQNNANEKLYPASITKIMTALVALENSSLDEVVTFSNDAVYGIEKNSSNVGVYVGEQMTMEQCLYAMLLESANEVSTGIAEHIAGSVEAFTKLMNAKAKELGCKNTHFTNANGLHDDNHYTSAYDMALISQEAYKYSTFRTIISTKQFIVPSTNMREEPLYFNNHHEMMNPRKYLRYRYEYCTGGKTGYTDMAKNTLVSYATKDGVDLICVVMKSKNGQQPQNIFSDTIDLFDYVFNNFTQYSINDDMDTASFDSSQLFTRFNNIFSSKHSPISISNKGNILIPNSVSLEQTTRTIEYDENVTIKEGENIIGHIVYTYGDRTVGRTDIIYTSTKDTLNFGTEILKKNTSDNQLIQLITKNDSDEISLVKVLLVIGVIIFILIAVYFALQIRKRKKDNTINTKRRKKFSRKHYNDFMNF